MMMALARWEYIILLPSQALLRSSSLMGRSHQPPACCRIYMIIALARWEYIILLPSQALLGSSSLMGRSHQPPACCKIYMIIESCCSDLRIPFLYRKVLSGSLMFYGLIQTSLTHLLTCSFHVMLCVILHVTM